MDEASNLKPKKYPVKLIKKKSGKGYISYMIYLPKNVIKELKLEEIEYLVLEYEPQQRIIKLKPLE